MNMNESKEGISNEHQGEVQGRERRTVDTI